MKTSKYGWGAVIAPAQRLFFVMLLSVIAMTISGCDPLIVKVAYASQKTDFILVSPETTDCPRVYRDADALYVISKPMTERQIQIYIPGKGLTYTAPFTRTTLTTGVYGGQRASGGNACLLDSKGWQTGEFRSVSYVAQPEIRKLLDEAFDATGATQPTTMQFDRSTLVGLFAGGIPAYVLGSLVSVSDRNLEEAKGRLLELSISSIADDVDSAESKDRARVQAASDAKLGIARAQEREWARERAMAEEAQQNFTARAAKPKSIGQTVCTEDNRVAFVEGAAGQRIQVRIVGEVLNNEFGSLKANGLFRGDVPGNYKIVNGGRILWDDAFHWGACDLRIR